MSFYGFILLLLQSQTIKKYIKNDNT